MERLDGPPQTSFFHQFRGFPGRHPNPASLMLFRPVVLLMRNFQRIDLDVAHHRLIFLQPAFAELTNTPIADGSVDAGFFIGFGSRCLLRGVVLYGPPLGTDQRRFFLVVISKISTSWSRIRYGRAANCLNFIGSSPGNPKNTLEQLCSLKTKRHDQPLAAQMLMKVSYFSA
jgi:hypothetical protein